LRGTALFLGAAFAIVATPALYLVLAAPGDAQRLSLSKNEPRIVPGFIGVARFGQWRLICVPGPARADILGGRSHENAAQDKADHAGKINSCRINQEMPVAPQNLGSPAEGAPMPEPDAEPGFDPGPILVAANFRLAGSKRTPAAMLRLPVTARTGDPVGLRFDDGAVVQTPVRDCARTECLAVGTLTPVQWKHLSAAKSLQVRFPATGRQWVLLDLPLQGLSTAIAALQLAEISPPA
jgi:hypothetical protein